MPKLPDYLINKLKIAVDNSTYREVAGLTRLGKTIVWEIYNGQPRCTKGTLKKLIDAFGVQPEKSSDTTGVNQTEQEFPGRHLPPHPFTLSVEFPERQFDDDLQLTERLSMTGTNLRRHDDRQKVIKDFLLRGGTIDALLVDPQSTARRFAAFQEHGNDEPQSLKKFLDHLRKSREWLCSLKTSGEQQILRKS